MQEEQITQLIDEALEFLWQDSPVFATFVGIHKYDSELEKLSPENRSASIQKKKEFRNRIEQVLLNRDITLNTDQKMDLVILKNALSTDIEMQEKYKQVMRDGAYYPELVLTGILLLMLRNFAPLEERAKSVLGRLNQVPRLMEEGINNLQHGENFPIIWTGVGIETTQSGLGFFTQAIPAFAEKAPELKEALLAASQKATEAFQKYLDFLKAEIEPKSNGSFATGRQLFQYLLETEHQLPYTADDLIALGEEQIKVTQEKIYQVGRRINSTIHWKNIIKESKTQHPQPEELVNFYKQMMEESRNFVQEKGLVTIPEGQELTVMETPVFERHTTPYAAYMPPAPFEEKQEGFFWVTPPDASKTKEEQEEQLQGHSIHSIPITVSHEGYPGHHLQLSIANKKASKVRKQFGTNVFIEGWALYCEELMWEHGFYTEAEIRLMQLKDILWRACRVVIDCKLHLGLMTFEEGVDMLVKVAHLEPANAEAEVKRYTMSPTQPMSYLTGKLAILDFRAEYKTRKGSAFNLREFHDKLLSYGSIPIKMIKEEMMKGI